MILDMIRKASLIISVAFLFTACRHGEKTDNTPDSKVSKVTILQNDQKVNGISVGKTNNAFDSETSKVRILQKDERVEKALLFINAYVDNVNKMNKAVGVIDWANSNGLTTKRFKTELKKIVDDAHKQDPELGLEADPIVDAQDVPDEGFELDFLDEETNYLIVRGKDSPDSKLTMKVVRENGKWLVDGCGIVNIPDDKTAKR